MSFKNSMNPVFSQKLTTNVNVSGSRKPFSVESKQPVRSRPTKIHELCVYEINETDRGSPAYLRLGQKTFEFVWSFCSVYQQIAEMEFEEREDIKCVRVRTKGGEKTQMPLIS
ncbi:hypothetical protein L1987_25156 [Smallanthus sonchifolius]|uniref:Uncharacterized protein n=1 Tax=Smallanthus sonchifolius TaxID=185202 RepID=A0ACB9INW0_9ASTR|nr:hypothetical protein L1987_25156 [Smallanthus sonchifolius]